MVQAPFRCSVSKLVSFDEGDRVYYVGTGRKGTITAVYGDLAMVKWDDRTHDSADPMSYGQIVHVPDGWDVID